MRLRRAAIATLIAAGLAPAAGFAQADPFAFFQPWVQVTPAERARLDTGDVFVRTLPAEEGHLAIFAAARVNATPDILIEWTHAIREFKESQHVVAVRRFSDVPALTDLTALTLDEGDLDALRDCEPGDCGVKLAADEITAIRRGIAGAGTKWREVAQEEFRRVLLARVIQYKARGLTGLAPYADRSRPREPRVAFEEIMARSPYLSAVPGFAGALTGAAQVRGGASFFYWSKERYGAGKHVITISHVQLLQPDGGPPLPDAIVASKQIFATHYTDAALGVTTLSCDPATGSCYLAYINRTKVDLLGGMLGGLKRLIFEKRIASGTPDILRELRRRIESGRPNTLTAR